MSTEVIQFHRKKGEVLGSKAFNLEYYRMATPEEMRDDVVSYLGEYRFKLKNYDYELAFSKGADGKYSLRDATRGEALSTKAERTLSERDFRGDPTHREENELTGVRTLEERLRWANTGDEILWMSPPGPKSEGYGTYGFLYRGKVNENPSGDLKLQMRAIRLESGDIDAYNKAFSEVTGVVTKFNNADVFLANPRLRKGGNSDIHVEQVLQKNFSFKKDVNQDKDFQTIIGELDGLIGEVISKIKYAGPQEKVQAFNTLENTFLARMKALEEERESNGKVKHLRLAKELTLDNLKDRFGYAPPEAAGSCGSTASSLAAMGVRSVEDMIKAQGEEYSFDTHGNCVSCGKEDVAVGPCNICQPCDSKIRKTEKVKEASLAPFKRIIDRQMPKAA